MLFRIEDTENIDGCHRQYTIPFDELPRMRMSELEKYLASEVRKEINNANGRRLLSYSKSLGVCLLKYNHYTDNELHISRIPENWLWYYDCKKQQRKAIRYDMRSGLPAYERNHPNREITLLNFSLDVSDNSLVDSYLRSHTGVGKKKVASPEKDKEVLVMQSPDDLVVSQYTSSVYLLYALVRKYGMTNTVAQSIYNKIATLEEFRFNYCDQTERTALLAIVEYLYNHGIIERAISHRVFVDSQNDIRISTYYDPILQLHGIQEDDFGDSYMLSDYNSNIISEWIWEIYSRQSDRNTEAHG